MATYSTSPALEAQNTSVSGTSERTITGSGVLNDNDANVVGGFGERIVPMIPEVGNGDFRPTEYHLVNGEGVRHSNVLSGISQVGSSSVSGVAENIITASGALTTSSSTVTGVAENKITGSGATATGDSTVSGTSERVVVEIEADLTADEVGVVAITGESERIIVGSGAISVAVSSVSGTTVITSNGTGALQSQSSSVSATVTGGANGQGTLVSQDSTVLGVSENVIVGNGSVAPASSSVSGIAERQIDASGSGASQDESADVVGVAERTVTGSGTIVVEATLFPATGFSERSIVGSGTAPSQSSSVSGQGERSVDTNDIVLQVLSGPSSVSGTGVRHSIGAGVLSSQVSIVSGASEREITGSGSIETVTDSIVSGVAENVIDATGTLTTSSSSVSGVSERAITGSGTLDTITDSTVAVVAERTINLFSGIEQVDVSTVSGVSERTINAVGELNTVSDSVVSAISERVNTATGSLTTNASVVVGTTSRTINRLPDIDGYPEGHGDTAFGPDDADSQVDYVSRPQSYAPRYLELSSTSNVNRDGVYDVLISGFTVAESGLNYTTSPTTTYNVYYKEHGSNYDVVVYNTTRSAWYLTTIANIDDFFTGSISNATVAQESITSSNSIVPYGIEFDPLDADLSKVVGLAERIIVDVFTDLQGPEHNILNGVSEREATAGTGFLQDEFSKVVAVVNVGRITSPELVNVSSVVDGVAERIVTVDDGIEQTDASVVAGVSERTINGEGTLVQSTDSVVAGVVERIITVDAGIIMPDDASDVIGVAERIITGEGTLQSTESVVTGVSERIITGSGNLVDSSSSIVGVAERKITGTGALDTVTESLVTGVAERIITVTGIDMPDDDSKVAGVAERIVGKFFGTDPKAPDNIVNGLAERTVENNNITLQVIAQESHVVGVAERTINLLSGIEKVQESKVTAIAERQIDGEGDLNTITDSLVTGIAERQIDGEGDLNTITDSLVSGVAERIINSFSGIDMPDDDSKVAGVAERTINLFSGIEQVQESVVSGVAERTINQLDGGDLKPTTNNLVTGVAEREVETNEISQDLKPTDNNLVTGVAERIINLFESPKAQDADVGQDPEPIVIIRHPIGGTTYPEYRSDLYAGDAQPTLDADRVHTQETDGLSTKVKFAPSISSSKVDYSDKYLILSGMTNSDLEGKYDLLPDGFTVSVSSGNNLTLSTNKNYLVYYRKQGYQDYRAVVFRTNDLTWVAFETTLNPELFFQHGTVLTNAQLNGELVAFSSQSRGGPYKIMRPTIYNLVTGEAERNVEDNSSTHELIADESVVSGSATRKVKPLDGALHSQPSVVVGVAERKLDDQDKADLHVNADPSTVSGVGVRHANGSGVLVSGQSSVVGLAENQIDGEEGIAQVDDALVEGSGVRHSNVLDGIEQGDPSTVNGVSQRTVNGFGNIHSGEDHVTMVSKRTVVSIEATIKAGPVQVIATDDRVSVGVPGKCDPKAQDATVTATVTRTSNSLEATLATESDVIGEGHRTSNGSGELSSIDHLVDGISERKITAVGVCEAQDSTVVAVAEREIVSIRAALNASSSVVEGFAFRKIIGEGELQTTDCKVSAFVYTNNIEQEAIHTQRKFRIRKPRMRTILARQTPTN